MNRHTSHANNSPYQEKVWKFYSKLPKQHAWYNKDIIDLAKDKLSLSRATTYRYIKMLREKGFITKIVRGSYKLNSNELKINVGKKNTISSSDEETRDRKTFVKKRH